VLFGCGGDSGSAAGFVTEANRICAQTQREFARIQRRPPRSAEQAVGQAEALADVSSKALDELRSLEPPGDSSQTYDRYLKARETALGYIEDGRDAAADKDVEAYARAKRRAAESQATRLQLARGAGLRRCSTPGVTLSGG
jgi:hypothetical protein